MNKVKREAIRVIAQGLPAQEIANLEATFKSIDTDHSGTITAEELITALKSKASLLKQEGWDALKEAVEADASGGGIEYEEFLASTIGVQRLHKEENMMRAFKHFDTDGSGTITRDEIVAALKECGENADADVDAIIAGIDQDGNGKIDYQEFCTMLMRRT